MTTRSVVLAVLLLIDHVLARQPAVVTFLALWSATAATWVSSGAPLW